MNETTFTHSSSDGIGIFVRRWSGDSAPKALVLVAHGVAEHSGRYARLASALVPRGCEVWAPDHRGHGRTAQASGGRGWFAAGNGFRRVVDDLAEIRRPDGRGTARSAHLPAGSLHGELPGPVCTGSSTEMDWRAAPSPGICRPGDPFLAAASDVIVAAGRALQGGRGIAKFAHGLTLGSYAKPVQAQSGLPRIGCPGIPPRWTPTSRTRTAASCAPGTGTGI
ncbi:MAG: lysophospholipase [Chromatiales bacterium]|nr:lysophospholipase [Chromatiales bacterium]